MQLAEQTYSLPYGTLTRKYTVADSAKTLGKDFDFSIVYEHSARNEARTNPNYRYVRLPGAVAMTDPTWEQKYHQVFYSVSGGQGFPSSMVRGTRLMFGLTMLKTAPHPSEALQFLEFMLSQEGMDIQRAAGLDPIPAVASKDDFQKLPAELQKLVTAQ
jgi:ABC-type molybdate transport system substrate-binding protein